MTKRKITELNKVKTYIILNRLFFYLIDQSVELRLRRIANVFEEEFVILGFLLNNVNLSFKSTKTKHLRYTFSLY